MTAITPPATPEAPPPQTAAPEPAPQAAPDASAPPDAPRDPATGQFLRIKPIKLPGVMGRTKAGSKTLAQEIDEASAPRESAAEPADAAPAENAAPETAPAPDSNAPAAKLKFDGREFDTAAELQAYAETQLKTARNSQAAASRNAQLQANRAKTEIEQQYNARIEALEQRILRGSQPAANSDPNAPAQLDPSEQQFWREVQAARESAALLTDPASRAREETLINYAITNFMLDKRMNELQAALDARLQPFEQTATQSREFAQANSLFESVAAFNNPTDNSPQFPELLDSTDADGVVQIWHNQTRGMKAEDRYDPKQVVLAVLAYRALKAEMTKGQPKPAQPAPPAPPKPAPPAPRPAANGAVLQQSNINGAARTSLPGGQTLPGVWSRSR